MADPVKIIFLGGLGDIGRNCAAIEIADQIMLIDCGILFPDDLLVGVDLVLPDFSYLRDNAEKVVGAVATHGHEDHIGALSFLLEEIPLKIIGSPLTIGLAKNRIEEKKVSDNATYVEVKDNQRIQIGAFDLEFFPVTHSVPNGFATAFHTPQGVILHSGDFKLDMSPVDGRFTDLSGLGHLASTDGVRLFLCDSTNAEEKGFSSSESSIGESLNDLFRARSSKRMIVACFASHIHRIQQIADAAVASGRKVATLGLSMKKNVAVSREMGLLNIPERSLINIDNIDNVPDEELCVISTGSQGEPLSALARMAKNDSHWLSIKQNDCVVLSSHPIPGNESSVARVIDGLIKSGAEVVHSGSAYVHTTGHAKSEELRVMHSITKPEWFVPVHGEYRHMLRHAEIAVDMGLDPENVIICGDGQTVELTDEGLQRGDDVPAEYIYIAGRSKLMDKQVVQQRCILGNEGFVSVVVPLQRDSSDNVTMLSEPEIISRGWVGGHDEQELYKQASETVKKEVEKAISAGKTSSEQIQKAAKRALGKFVNHKTRLKPMIVATVLG